MNILYWVELKITKQDREKAREIAVKRMDYMKKISCSSTNHFKGQKSEIIGLLGEIKFGEFMGLAPNLRTDAPGSVDFRINGKIVDVKTNESRVHPSLSSNNYLFLINRAQFDRHKDVGYYVSVMVFEDKAWICGYLPQNEVMGYPIITCKHSPCYAIPFPYLHDPCELIGPVAGEDVEASP